MCDLNDIFKQVTLSDGVLDPISNAAKIFVMNLLRKKC